MRNKILLVVLGIVFAEVAIAAVVFNLPFSKDHSWTLTQGYNHATHTKYQNHGTVDDRFALDFALTGCRSYGQPVLAPAAGTVVVAKEAGYNGGFGTNVVIKHEAGYYTRYAHMKNNDLEVFTGEKVFREQVIGYVSNTGFHFSSSACPEYPGAHLHFAVYKGGKTINVSPFYVDGEGVKPDSVMNHDRFIAGNQYTSDNTLITRQQAIAMREQEEAEENERAGVSRDDGPPEVEVVHDAWPFDVAWEGIKGAGRWTKNTASSAWDFATGIFGGGDQVADTDPGGANISGSFSHSLTREDNQNNAGNNEQQTYSLPRADTTDEFINTSPQAGEEERNELQNSTDNNPQPQETPRDTTPEPPADTPGQEDEAKEDVPEEAGENKDEDNIDTEQDIEKEEAGESTDEEKEESSEPVNTGGDKRYGPNGPVVFPYARQQNRVPSSNTGSNNDEEKEESGNNTPDHLVINEVQVNKKEFVELYNPTAKSVNLGGWHFAYYSSNRKNWVDDSDDSISPDGPHLLREFPGKTISSGGYYLIGLNNITPPQADWSPYNSSQLSNSNGTVAIFKTDPESSTSTKPVDAVGWGDVTLKEDDAVEGAPIEGESISRDSAHSDTNDNKDDFEPTDPTPKNGLDTLAAAVPQWGSYQGNQRNAGVTQETIPNSTTTISWSYKLDSRTGLNQPLVGGNGNVYITTGAAIYSFTPGGVLNWKYTGLNGRHRPRTALSADSQKLYVARFGAMTTLNTKTGKVLNSVSTGDIADAFPIYDVASDIVFAVSEDKVYAFDEWGNKKWVKTWKEISEGKITRTDKAFDPVTANGTLYLTAGDNGSWRPNLLFALNPQDGSTLWNSGLSSVNHVGGSPAITSDGSTFVVGTESFSNDFGFAAYDLTNKGAFLWETPYSSMLGSPYRQLPAVVSSSRIYGVIPPIGELFRYEENGGSPLSTVVFSSYPNFYTTTVIADSVETLIFGTKDGALWVVDGTRGLKLSKLWSKKFDDGVRGITVTDGKIIVTTDERKVYVLQ